MKCWICGTDKKIINHHLDYYKDKTIPMCMSCHQKWHRDNKTIGTRKEMFLLQRIKKGMVKDKEWEKYSNWFYKVITGKKK